MSVPEMSISRFAGEETGRLLCHSSQPLTCATFCVHETIVVKIWTNRAPLACVCGRGGHLFGNSQVRLSPAA